MNKKQKRELAFLVCVYLAVLAATAYTMYYMGAEAGYLQGLETCSELINLSCSL